MAFDSPMPAIRSIVVPMCAYGASHEVQVAGNGRRARTLGQLVHGLTLGGCRSPGTGAFVHRCSGVGNASTRATLGDREAARGMRRNVAMAQHDTSLHIAARTTASGLPDAHHRTSAYAVNDHDVVERQARCPASTPSSWE